MTPEQFCYWLNGYAELTDGRPTKEQWKAMKEHLSLVFTKVTPPAPGTLPATPPGEHSWPSELDDYPRNPFGGPTIIC